MELALIAAVARNRVIGSRGEIPWHLSADLKRLKRLTMGHALILGRKTYDSIGRPLPGRRMIVVSRQTDWCRDRVVKVGSFEAALRAAEPDDLAFCGGGSELYRLALPIADELFITWVDAEPAGDVFFPPFDEDDWGVAEEKIVPVDDRNDHASRFVHYTRTR